MIIKKQMILIFNEKQCTTVPLAKNMQYLRSGNTAEATTRQNQTIVLSAHSIHRWRKGIVGGQVVAAQKCGGERG